MRSKTWHRRWVIPNSLGVGGLDGVGITLITPASNKQADRGLWMNRYC
jgi:hypothetical protein